MSKVLIVGGLGFIGSYLTWELISRGYKVVICDPYGLKKGSFREILVQGATIYNDTYEKCNFSVWDEKPDYVIHLAAHPIESQFDSDVSRVQLEQDIVTTYLLVRDYHRYGKGKKFIFMSSVFAYGDFNYSVNEDHSLNPKTIYGISKATGEYIVRSALDNWNIIRTTSVYGYGDTNRRATNIFVDKALKKQKMWVNTSALLDFIYIKDLVYGIIEVMVKAPGKEVYHVSGGRALTLMDFVLELKHHFPDLVFEKHLVDDRPTRGSMANDKMRFNLGWEPAYNLESGVNDYISLVKQYGAE